jgi:hypothetical protein
VIGDPILILIIADVIVRIPFFFIVLFFLINGNIKVSGAHDFHAI